MHHILMITNQQFPGNSELWISFTYGLIFMGLGKTQAEREQIFRDKYEALWVKFQHQLSENERSALNLYFGISGEFQDPRVISEYLEFGNSQYSRIVIQRALGKLRRAAIKEQRLEIKSLAESRKISNSK